MDNDTKPDWEGETEDEETMSSWPWGEMGRPSDSGLSEGILAERPNLPAGEPLQQRGGACGKGGGDYTKEERLDDNGGIFLPFFLPVAGTKFAYEHRPAWKNSFASATEGGETIRDCT